MADSNARAQAALAYFRSRGYSDVGAAAIVGNLVQESGLDPTKVHDNGTGLGMGTSGGRRSQLRAFAAAQGKPDDDFMTQLAFLDHELNTSEKGVGDALRSASDVTAANAAMISFERPQGWTKDNPQAGHGWANRLANAQRLLGGGASVSIPTGVDFGGAVDAAPVSRLEAWQHEQEAKAEGPGLWGTLSAAIDENSITKDLLTAKPEFTPDLNYRLDDKEVKNLQETYGIRDDNLSDLEDAVSPGHAEWLSKQIQAKQQRQDTIAQAGVGGIAASLAVGMLDPASLAASVASGGLASMAATAVRAGRLGRAAIIAATEAGTNAALAGAQGGHTDEVLLAAGTAAVLGGGFGYLSHAAPDLSHDMNMLGRRMIEEAQAPAGSAGAMAATSKMPLRDAAVDLSEVDAPTTAFAKIRNNPLADMVGYAKTSEVPLIRAIGGLLGEDAVASVDDKGNVLRTAFGATERQARYARQMEGKALRGVMPAWQAWAKEQGLSTVQRWWGGEKWHEFNEEVTRYMRNRDPAESFDPNVVTAGDALRGVYGDYAMLAQNPGLKWGTTRRAVAGFQNIDPREWYVPRLYDFHKLNQVITRHGEVAVVQLFRKALQEQQINLEDEVAHRVATGMVKKLRERSADLSSRLDRPLGSDDEAYLVESLKGLGVDELDAASLAKQLRPQADASAGPRGKFRALLNEGTELETADGTIRISDLTRNNAMDLFQVYNRDMSGRIALAQIDIKDRDGVVLVDGITHDGEFGSLIDAARAQGDALGVNPDDTRGRVKTLDTLYRAVLGQSDPSESGLPAQVARTVMQYNVLRLMNNMGIAQAAEMGSILGNLGLRTTLRAIPTFGSFVRDARTGKFVDGLNEEIEAVLGMGVDDLKGAMPNRLDAEFFGDAVNPRLERADQLGRQAGRIVSRASGMQWLNRRMQVLAMRGIAYRFAEMAKNPTKINMKRMLTLGLDQPMLDRVLKEFATHKSTAMGDIGKITRMNLDKWTDVEARAAFEDAMFRWGRKVIQENDPGALPRFMQHRLGKMLFQFRTFMLGSFFKQTLWHLKMRDREALGNVMWSMMVGGVVYTAQTLAQASTRSDREKFLQERLAPGQMAANVFQRTGFSSIMPLILDIPLGIVAAPRFTGRTTGQDNDPVFGMPAASLYSDITGGLSGVVAPLIQGKAPSQNAARNLVRALPFGNHMAIQTPLSAILSGLPEKAPR
jgi:hypothetical protein